MKNMPYELKWQEVKDLFRKEGTTSAMLAFSLLHDTIDLVNGMIILAFGIVKTTNFLDLKDLWYLLKILVCFWYAVVETLKEYV